MLYLPYTIEFGLWTVYQLSHTCFQWTVLLDDGHVAQRGVAGCTFGFTSGWAGAIVAGGLLAWSVMSCSSAQCCLSDEFTCLVKSTGIRRIRDYWYPLDPSGNQRWPWKITWIGTGRSRNIWTIGGCSSTSSESCCAPHDSFRGILSGAEVILIDGDSHHLLHLHEVDFARAISEEALRPYHLFLGRHVQWHAATSVAGVSRIRRMQGWMFHTLGLRFVIPTANDCTILV